MNNEALRRRILVIDDNDAIHGDFRKTLERQSPTERLAATAAALFGPARTAAPMTSASMQFEVETALQGEEGLRMVVKALHEKRPYALAFVDMRMPPGWDGVETIEHLWKADPELQVVICTAFTDYSWEQIISRLGMSDRLLILKKPFDPMEVCQLATALSEKWKLKRQAILKLEELEKMVHERTRDLRRIALNDKLTGLPNRACIQDLVRQAVVRATQDSAFKFAVFFIDFDRFKIINDSLGHQAGDELLTTIAARLRDLLGQTATDDLSTAPMVAARLGGDEFVVLLRNIRGIEDATALADKLLTTLNNSYRIGEHDVHTTASMGLATNEMGYQWSDDILRDADTAMYRAKAQGKARYVIFSPEMHQETVARLSMENDLRKALERGELQLQYQPIVSLADARLLGFEALLRWQHPERGTIAPGSFIPMAEETGLIVPIGQWVIQEATRQLQEWTARNPAAAELSISVNCSRKQFADPTLVGVIESALAAHGIAPHRLNLEITESTIMESAEECRLLLTRISAMGVRLHMDDFGTGYSSLNCLHTLPLNTLKIDRSFIANVSQRRDYAAIIDAIIALAHNLNMKVIAEGVETADHAAMLVGLDCDEAQGFFFSRPLSPGKAEEFISAGVGTLVAT